MSKRGIAAYTVLGLAVVLLLTLFPEWTVDDAYITFRYSDNLVQHGQLTYNFDADPIEGYTGILLPILIAAAMLLHIPPELASQLIGMTSFLFLLYLFYRLIIRLTPFETVRWCAVWLLGTAAFIYIHVFSGLETILFTALLIGSALDLHTLLRTEIRELRPHCRIALLLLALSLCRPEGAAYAMIALGTLSCISLFRQRTIKPLLAYLLCFVLPGLIYFILRWNYYGHLLPNTFYAKLHDGLSWDTVQTILSFGKRYLFFPVLLTAGLWGLTGIRILKKPDRKKVDKADLLLVASLIAFTLIVILHYLRSALAMNFSFRFYTPFYPIALLSLVWLVSPCIEILRSCIPKSMVTKLAATGAMLLMAAQTGVHVNLLLTTEVPYAYGYNICLEELHRSAGRYLRKRLPPDEWIAVHIDAGAIPYFSGLNAIDFGSLNDEYLAHLKPGSQQERVDYFFTCNPAAVAFTSFFPDRVSYSEPEAEVIIADPRFADYALVRIFDNSAGIDYYQYIFLRRDLLQPGEEIILPDTNT